MENRKKIAFLTGTRADYGLLRNLIRLFQADDSFHSYVLVTGSHLSQKHNRTIDLIHTDGLINIVEIPLPLEGDSPSDICRGMQVEMQGINSFFVENPLDLLIVLGDRYELWPACMTATIFNIPICHIHGGESTEGLIDEAIRHSVTKMAHLHFCSHEIYRDRIIRMGEQPEWVHNVGAIGLDRIRDMDLLSKQALEEHIGTSFGPTNVLCAFHPVTLERSQTIDEVEALVSVIEEFVRDSDIRFFVIMPNADTYSDVIKCRWHSLLDRFPMKVFAFVNFNDHIYISLMNSVDAVLGNSSSGIIEAPYLNKPVVNIGDRQRGRLTSRHVLQAKAEFAELKSALCRALSPEFRQTLRQADSIYGDGNASKRIYETFKDLDFNRILFKKFYDGVKV